MNAMSSTNNNNMNITSPKIEIAPIVNQKGNETNFKGAGYSHFSYIESKGFYVSTQAPGLGGVAIHDDIMIKR